MGFSLKLQKSLTSNDIFHFVVSESHDGGVWYAHNMWLLILLILFFIFAIFSNKLIPTKYTYHDSLLLQSCEDLWEGGATKISPWQQWQWTYLSIAGTIYFLTGHSGSSHCTNGFSTLQATSLVCLFVARGRECYVQLCLLCIPRNPSLWFPMPPVSLYFSDVRFTKTTFPSLNLADIASHTVLCYTHILIILK